ncbi:MAG TPA: hypothetical protein VMG12_16780 [Polyangiaceae bacterium]|nr:hypothetical protein [Polyangiaceae bacterium]
MLNELWHSFQEGGWAMYAIFAFGITGVASAGRFAWRGEHQLLGFVRWMAVTVLSSGWFGFFIGMQRAFEFMVSRVADEQMPTDLPSMERRAYILFEALKEALSCVSGSLMFLVIICMLGAIGHRRFPVPNPGSVLR